MKSIAVKASIILISVFACGILTGVILTRLPQSRMGPNKEHHGPRHNMVERIHEQIIDQLGLDESQAREIHEILLSGKKEMQNLMRHSRPNFDAIREKNHQAIIKILTPEQQVEFQQLIERQERRRRKNHNFRNRTAPPPPNGG